ncbi:MaoC/PaaZ C-terminal domain-containing protein [Brevibacterium album]|uniref:MaoC/PaaZ C-terminal domain-containing protein n=1 Tax=Brevibacterium album TaxID=417948 RepID=UPI00041B27AA|nr:MaoC/PaaZ C-terminal domain-containing protein [Brevibacterium album]
MMLRTYAQGALQSLRLRLRPAASGDLSRVAGPQAERRRIEFVADPQRVAEFCRVVGEPVGNTVPVTCLHAEAFGASLELMSRPDFPLPLIGMVHLANSVTQHRPVEVGETVVAEVWIVELRAHPKGTEVVVTVRFEVAGEMRVEETSTMLAKGITLEGAAPAADARRKDFTPPEAPTQRWRFTGADASAYARVSGDRNPIHLSAAAAKAFGFPARIAHGMHTAARALAAAQVRTRPFSWEVEFASPVLLPGTVSVRMRNLPAETVTEVWSPKKGRPHMFSRIALR